MPEVTDQYICANILLSKWDDVVTQSHDMNKNVIGRAHTIS